MYHFTTRIGNSLLYYAFLFHTYRFFDLDTTNIAKKLSQFEQDADAHLSDRVYLLRIGRSDCGISLPEQQREFAIQTMCGNGRNDVVRNLSYAVDSITEKNLDTFLAPIHTKEGRRCAADAFCRLPEELRHGLLTASYPEGPLRKEFFLYVSEVLNEKVNRLYSAGEHDRPHSDNGLLRKQMIFFLGANDSENAIFHSEDVEPLLPYALCHGMTIWNIPGKSAGEALIMQPRCIQSMIFNAIDDPRIGDQLTQPLMEKLKNNVKYRADYRYESTLLPLCFRGVSSARAKEIYDMFLTDHITVDCVQHLLNTPLHDEGFLHFVAYTGRGFRHSMNAEDPKFRYAIGALTARSFLDDEDPVAGLNGRILSNDPAETSFGIYALDIAGWAQPQVSTFKKYADHATSFSDDVYRKLEDLALKPAKRAVDAIRWGIYGKLLDPARFQPEFWNTVRERAMKEEFLFFLLLPLAPFCFRDAGSRLKPAQEAQQLIFRGALERHKRQDAILNFARCCALGVWSAEEAGSCFDELCRLVGKSLVDDFERDVFSRSFDQLAENGLVFLPEQDNAPSICFGLSEDEIQDDRFDLTDGHALVLRTEEDAVSFILAMKGCRYDGELATRFSRVHLALETKNNFILVNWFRLLCFYGHIDEATAFCRKHYEVFSKPDHFPIGTELSIAAEQYRAYISTHSRIYYAIKLIPSRCCPDALIALLPEEEQVAAIKYFGTEASEINKGPVLTDWAHLYDSTPILLATAKTRSAAPMLISGFGCCREIVTEAVKANGNLLKFVNKRFRSNPEICRLAIDSAPAAIRFVSDGTIDDAELRQRLLDSKLSLCYVPERFAEDEEVARYLFLKEDLSFAEVSPHLRSSCAFAKSLITAHRVHARIPFYLNLCTLHESLFENKEFAQLVYSACPEILWRIPDEIRPFLDQNS